jgi:hypothetical protein
MRFFPFFLVSLTVFTVSFSQNTTNTKIDSMLVDIDKTSFTSNILYERTFPWANLNSFNENENLANADFFEQAFQDVRKASKDSLFLSLQELRQLYFPDSISNNANIGVLNTKFHSINYNPDEESEGALTIQNERFVDLNNGRQKFIENHTLVVSPLKRYLKGETIIYNFNENLLFEDSNNKAITLLTANFDTTTDYILIQNSEIVLNSIPITYNENGYKTLTFTADFEDGTTKTTQAIIHVIISPQPPPLGTLDRSINATIPFKGYDESYATLGRLDYRIYFGNNQNKILKPVIIIDGFDPGDRRKISDSDSNLPPDDHDSIEEFMVFYIDNDFSSPQRIIPMLRADGYDVIIVNHPTYQRNVPIDGGADFIERNGLTHVALYEYINAELAQNNSNEELVIIGPSMGGQISRYALAYMEKNNIPHNTRLWVSLDSPHLGANIPIGLQTLVNQVANSDNVAAQDFVNNQLGSAAAKQQLIEQFHSWNSNQLAQNYLNAKTIEQGYSTERGHWFFRKYYSDLFNNGLNNSKGYPQNLRKIALVNGSLLGNKKYFSPYTQQEEYFLSDGEMGFNARAFQIVCSPWPLCWELHVGSLEAFGMPSTGNNTKVSRFKKPFEDKSKYVTNYNNRGSLDNVPGGWFPGFQEIAEPIDGTDPIMPSGGFWSTGEGFLTTLYSILSNLLGGANISVYDNEKVNSFIPVFSSLGFFNPDRDWTEEMDRNLACTNEIPFDTYFGPKNNEQHTSFTQESIDWLMEELNENEQQPTVYLFGSDIQGPEVVCETDIVWYGIPLCKGVPDYWEVSSNLNIITRPTNMSSVSVQPVSNTVNAAGYVRAVYSYQTVQKNIWIGRAGVPTFLNGPEEVHTGSMQTYVGGGSQGADYYKWILPYPFDENVDVRNPIDFAGDHWQMWPNNSGYNNKIFTGNGGHDGLVQLVSVNSCGEGGSKNIYVTHDNSGSCTTCYDPVYPYPNSADIEFSLDFTQHPDKIYTIKIYNQYSSIVYEGESTNIEKTVSTANLDNGTYFLHIHEDDNVTIKQLLVQH